MLPLILLVRSCLAVVEEVLCPSGSLVRSGRSLCDDEVVYLSRKSVNNQLNLRQYLNESAILDNNSSMSLVFDDMPRVGVALSGGGYRSMLTSTGFLRGLNEDLGLLEYTDYITGVSGGSWCVMDLIISEFDTAKLLTHWNLNDSLLPGIPEIDVTDDDLIVSNTLQKRDSNADVSSNTPPVLFTTLLKLKQFLLQNSSSSALLNSQRLFHKLNNFRKNIEFYIDLHLEVRPKKMAGFPVSFTDYWAQSLMKNTGTHDKTMHTAVTQCQKFQEYRAPIPIIVATSRNGPRKNVIFEFTPWEFGSWDPQIQLFAKLQYLGSEIINGTSIRCFKGLDQLGYIAATSSSVFNNALVYVWQLVSRSSTEAINAVKTVMSIFGLGAANTQHDVINNEVEPGLDTDYAVYRYNPFYQYHRDNVDRDPNFTSQDHIYLVDGGEDGENIPLRPLIQRELDVVFMLDVSSDSDNYANGDKLNNVLRQVQLNHGINYKMPSVLKSNNVTVIGCHYPTRRKSKLPPILLYYANMPHYNMTNTSTFKMTYTDQEIETLTSHGRDLVLNFNDPSYRTCLKCILIKRSLDRSHTKPSQLCNACYRQYCSS